MVSIDSIKVWPSIYQVGESNKDMVVLNNVDSISCAVCIVEDESMTPVVFKNDGERFEQPTTLKLLAKQCYQFKFVLKYSAEDLKEVIDVHVNDHHINGYTMTKNNSVGKEIELVFQWNTDHIEPTAAKKRDCLYLQLEFNNSCKLVMPLQAKFYGKRSSHLSWGRQLKAIAIEARLDDQLDDKDYAISHIEFGAVH